MTSACHHARSPAPADTLTFGLYMNGTGKVWLDSVVVEVIEQ